LLAIRHRQKNAALARVFVEPLPIENIESAATVFVPIVEAGTPKMATEAGALMENEEIFAKEEEIPHNQENRQASVYHINEENEEEEEKKLDEKEIIEKVG